MSGYGYGYGYQYQYEYSALDERSRRRLSDRNVDLNPTSSNKGLGVDIGGRSHD